MCYYQFHAFMHKPVLQICAEELISSVEFQIGRWPLHETRYEN